MGVLKHLADNTKTSSLANVLRRRRFYFFRRLLELLPCPITILDIGGTNSFWQQMNFENHPDITITLLNLVPVPTQGKQFRSLVGDGRDLSQFKNGEFDIVFSNSVIEHVGELAGQRKMAEEIARVGRRYFVQTPNYYFPIEPHFLFPCFQFLPLQVKVFLLRHLALGWAGRVPDEIQARAVVNSIRLLKEPELRNLFPGASIYKERVLGLTKSFVAYKGWNEKRV